ncbi:hypothetical protein [uncultured Agrobacterium sp.]|uniref:hypothetical protein n=1 Tax=uncultured Agrobacterium sp. TaxID=157277 RepID=UPI0025DB5A81|nr:hypothetical protein [uncultured Agrobacterium sp.]
MSPEENRDRTPTQAGATVKQTAYEEMIRQGKFDLSALNKPAKQAADWSSNEINLRIKEQILRENPMLCSWVQVPKNAEAAKGELRELSFWERLSNVNLKDEAIELGEGAWEWLAETRGPGDVIEFGKGALGSGAKKIGTVTEGLGQMIYTPPGPNEAPGEEGWLNFVSEGLQSTGEWIQDSSEETFRAREKWKDSWARQAGELIGDELPNVAISAIPVAGRVLAPVVDGFANAGESASNARRAGADENAQTSAARSGFLLGALELPVDNLIEGKEEVEDGKGEKDRKAGKGWRRLGAELLFKATWTGAKDIAKKTGQNAIAIDYYKPDQKLDDGLLQAGVNGVAKSVMFQGIPKVVNKAFGQPQPRGGAEQPEAAGQTLTEISEHATSSKVRALHPEEFGDYLRVVTKDTPIETLHIEGKKFSDAFRNSGDNTSTAFRNLPGFDNAQLNVAISSGGDVKLRLSTYATHLAGGKYDSALLPHMRFDPRAKTLAEVQASRARESERSSPANSDAEAVRGVQEKNQKIAHHERQQDVQRLPHSGVLPEQAQSGAVALDATRGVRSAKTGRTREDYLRENPPAGASSTNGALGQAAVGPSRGDSGFNSAAAAVPTPDGNGVSSKGERTLASPPPLSSPAASDAGMPIERFKAILESSTAPVVRLESPSPSPEIFKRQGPVIPSEMPWPERRKTLERNGR